MSAFRRYSRCILITLTYLLTTIHQNDAAPAILSPNQIAPPHARSSAGRALPLPSKGQPPANVNRLPGGGAARPSSGSASGPPQEDSVKREETVSFKEVNGETVRVVVGSYGYESPEGLPVSFKYTADDEGTKAGFSIGTAAGGGGGRGGGSGGQKPGGTGGGAAAGAGSKGGAAKGGAGGGDRMYLPPS